MGQAFPCVERILSNSVEPACPGSVMQSGAEASGEVVIDLCPERSRVVVTVEVEAIIARFDYITRYARHSAQRGKHCTLYIHYSRNFCLSEGLISLGLTQLAEE
jgi:hypothetical protein